jgi:hypothetical protein
VRIVGALVNPIGPDLDEESVTLLDASPSPVDLAGWFIADRNKNLMKLAPEVLRRVKAHGSRSVRPRNSQ